MSDKEAVLELMKSLPSDVSLREIIQEIEFFTAVKEGFAEIGQGKGILIEEVEKRLTYVRTTPFIDRY